MTETKKSIGIKERFAQLPARPFWAALVVAMIIFAIVSFAQKSEPSNAQRTKSINQQLRCLECEGLSIYDSDTKTSKTIAKDVARRVKAGESDKTIFAYYENIYGEYIRLAPTSDSGNWLIYVVPAFFIAVFVVAIFLSVSKRASSRTRIFFWGAAGLIFIVGMVVFVNDTQATKAKTKEATEQKKSTEELLQQAVNESPSNENLRSLAIVQFAKANPDLVSALKNFDKAAALDENDAESRAYAAYIVFLAGQYEQGRTRANAAVAIDDQNATALFFRGMIYYLIPETDEAQKKANQDQANRDFDAVLAIAPDSEFASEITTMRSGSNN